MTEPRGDADVVLPDVPDEIAALPSHVVGLAIAAPADGGPFLVEGERTAVIGLQRGPVEVVRIDGVVVAERIRHLAGVPVNVVTMPGVLRREWVGPSGVGLETVVAARTLPLVAVQWTVPAASQGPGKAGTGATTVTPAYAESTVVIDFPAAGRARAVIGTAAAALPSGDGTVVAYGVTPAPARLSLADDGPGGLRLEARGLPAGTTTLLVARGTPAAVRSAFAAAAHLPGHAALAARSPAEDGLSLVTGIADIDEAFQWARARLSASLARSERGVGPAAMALWGAVAALGVGDAVGAARATRLVGQRDPAAGALFAARMSMCFGDTRPALEHAKSLLVELGHDGSLPDPHGCLAPALTSLAEALRYAAAGSFLAELRAAAARLPAPGATLEGATALPASAFRLPMVTGPGGSSGHGPGLHGESGVSEGDADGNDTPGRGASVGSPSATLGPWLAAAFEGEPASPAPPSAAAELGLAARFRTDPTRAWVAWRTALAGGMASGPAGAGSWDSDGRDAEGSDGGAGTPVAAALLVAASYGLLGIAPDAPSGRIRIAPRLADHLTAFRAHGITVGDSSISLTYERDGAVHRYTLEPTAAAVPPTVVFEPSVTGAVSSTRLDGGEVDLDVRRSGGRSVVPVQIPVDARRVLEIVGED